MQHSLTTAKRDADADLVEQRANLDNCLKQKEYAKNNQKEEMQLKKLTFTRNIRKTLEDFRTKIKRQSEDAKIDLERKKNSIEVAIKEEIAKREVRAVEDANKLQDLLYSLSVKEQTSEDSRKLKQKEFELMKELLSDPTQLKLKKLEMATKMVESVNSSDYKRDFIGKDDPVITIMGQFERFINNE